MTNLMHTLARASLVAAAALVLAACGGGGDGGYPPQQPPQAAGEVPDSATASVRAYTEYVGGLPASDSSEPLMVNKVVAPVSETAAPLPTT